MTTSPQVFELVDPARPALRGSGPRPLRTTVWRPAAARSPVVLLSHGTGGHATNLAWLAEALADAGWAVVGVDHHGNTAADPPYVAEAFARWWERPLDLRRALDQVLAGAAGQELAAALDPERVVAVGFSLGGYTAGALVGTRVSRAAFEAAARGRATLPPVPEYPGLVDELRARYGADPEPLLAGCDDDVSDPRVRAAVLICPSVAVALDPASLAAVRCPVTVLSGGADDQVLPDVDIAIYAGRIPGAVHHSLGPGVRHYDLLDAATPAARTEVHALAARLTVEALAPVAAAGAGRAGVGGP